MFKEYLQAVNMLDFLKRKPKSSDNTPKSSKSLFSQLKEGVTQLLHGKKAIDAELLEELETLLLSADLGVIPTGEVIQKLTTRLQRHELQDPVALEQALKVELKNLLVENEKPWLIPNDVNPFVILMVGVNGAGKTTTIGKLAHQFKAAGKQVILAAGDTFRAAAIEQLQSWGTRNQIPVVAQHSGADSASVIFDALQTATAKGMDILIADTAGRLHTQDTLMEELKKVVRVMRKYDSAVPHEILLVLDAGIGQNALMQAKVFHEALGVTGIVLTKLDGTAKGGIVFNIIKTLKIPIRFIGTGEGADDLSPFVANAFVESLFSKI